MNIHVSMINKVLKKSNSKLSIINDNSNTFFKLKQNVRNRAIILGGINIKKVKL